MSTGTWNYCVNEYCSVSVPMCVAVDTPVNRRVDCVLTSTAVCQFQGVLCFNRRVD